MQKKKKALFLYLEPAGYVEACLKKLCSFFRSRLM